ncbi:hypothetical protein PROFUN_12278 [Planoprotostelium fungivorum]|uniref:Uncharacterized protein n=1 Tax=Planoprotostelium fungivorum TaxID=1890364 RepID=A0A2P6N7S1_9EUKA|nr:hypothetical protein PROFUN_12278 [Planoprotostelium fungivorum]
MQATLPDTPEKDHEQKKWDVNQIREVVLRFTDEEQMVSFFNLDLILANLNACDVPENRKKLKYTIEESVEIILETKEQQSHSTYSLRPSSPAVPFQVPSPSIRRNYYNSFEESHREDEEFARNLREQRDIAMEQSEEALREAEAEVKELRRKLKKSNEENELLKQVAEDLESTKSELKASESEKKDLHRQISQLKKELRAAETEREDPERDIATAALEQQNVKYREEVNRLKEQSRTDAEEYEEMKRTNEELTKKTAEKDKMIDKYKMRSVNYEEKIQIKQFNILKLQNELDQMRERSVTLAGAEDLVSEIKHTEDARHEDTKESFAAMKDLLEKRTALEERLVVEQDRKKERVSRMRMLQAKMADKRSELLESPEMRIVTVKEETMLYHLYEHRWLLLVVFTALLLLVQMFTEPDYNRPMAKWTL